MTKGENTKLLFNLESDSPEVIIQKIEELKEKGTTSHFPGLLQLLHETENKDIRKQILSLFSELKSTNSVPLLMDAIQNKKYTPELKELLACCWQNGLNYSPYLPVFIDLVISEEFQVSFEAFTVIENMYGKIEEDIVSRQIDKIDYSMEIVDDQKRYLLNELKAIILNIPEQHEDLN